MSRMHWTGFLKHQRFRKIIYTYFSSMMLRYDVNVFSSIVYYCWNNIILYGKYCNRFNCFSHSMSCLSQWFWSTYYLNVLYTYTFMFLVPFCDFSQSYMCSIKNLHKFLHYIFHILSVFVFFFMYRDPDHPCTNLV